MPKSIAPAGGYASPSQGNFPAVCRRYPSTHLGKERQSGVKFLVLGNNATGEAWSPDFQILFFNTKFVQAAHTFFPKRRFTRNNHKIIGLALNFKALKAEAFFKLTAWFELRFTQDPSAAFSTFDMDQLGNVQQLRYKDHL